MVVGDGSIHRRTDVAVSNSEQVEALANAETGSAEAVRLYPNGAFAKAIPLAEHALAIREQALGPKHPEVASSLNAPGRMVLAGV